MIEIVARTSGICQARISCAENQNGTDQDLHTIEVDKSVYLVCDDCLPQFILDNSEDYQMLCVNGVARLLGLSRRTVWRMLSAGEIVEPVKLRGNTRWRRDDLQGWIDAGCPLMSKHEK